MSLLHTSGELAIVYFDAEKDVSKGANGNTWAKMRCVAKDRVRDANGTWADGDPCFIDVYINGKPAEHIAGSVRVGDLIVISGKLAQKEWTDKEGVKHDGYRIYADEFGVSTRFSEAPSERVRAEQGVDVATSTLGGSDLGFDEPPF